MEIKSIILKDGTKFTVGEFKLGGTIKSIEEVANYNYSDRGIIQFKVTNSIGTVITVPYHAMLYTVTK